MSDMSEQELLAIEARTKAASDARGLRASQVPVALFAAKGPHDVLLLIAEVRRLRKLVGGGDE